MQLLDEPGDICGRLSHGELHVALPRVNII
jgi:hypothetical protein